MAGSKYVWLAPLALAMMPAAAFQSLDQVFPPAPPSALRMQVQETAGVARSGEVLRSGVPLPRSLQITGTSDLAVIDGNGAPVPATFQVLARWHAPKADSSAPIQWLLVCFPATVAADATAIYTLVTDGSVTNPAPAQALSVVTQTDGQTITSVSVDTGAAVFSLGSDPGALFDTVTMGASTLAQAGANSASLFAADDVTLANHTQTQIDAIEVVHQDALSAIIKVVARYDMAPRGQDTAGPLAAHLRYQFTAGSATAAIRHVMRWEGTDCDQKNSWPPTACDGTPNGIRLVQARDSLVPAFAVDTVMVGDAFAMAPRQAAFANQEAYVVQELRTDRFASRSYSQVIPGLAPRTGEAADGAFLAAIGQNHSLGIAIDHMQFYEPQALRLLADGTLAADWIDDDVWIGGRQGAFATLAVTALDHNATAPTAAHFRRELWAPLNRPLRAWPEPQWFAASDAVDEFPWSTLEGDLALYDQLLPRVLENTAQNVTYKGLHGLMTYGVFPRYWADSIRSDELDCTDATPNHAWDDAYWCGSWTDYHNTLMAVPTWVMRSGEVAWLDELAFPGALRVLHTQIMQCSAGDDWFFCGQAPAGYGGYRDNFNSSHAYLENLITYYWLTGDETVIDILRPGAETMRAYLCERRPQSPCLPEDVNSDVWATIHDRTASQWFAVYRFLGLAGDDASFLEDWEADLGRAVTQFYVEQEWSGDGERYGFFGGPGVYPLYCPPEGSYWTNQLWMTSLYDMNNIYRLMRDNQNAGIGHPAVTPVQVTEAWARTLWRFGGDSLGAGGDPNGDWPNGLLFYYDELNRIGGIIGDTCVTDHPDVAGCANQNPPNSTAPCVEADTGGGDPLLYSTGKACLTGALTRGALQAQDSNMLDVARGMTVYALQTAWSEATATGGDQTIGTPYGMALGKIMGENLSRLHAAVALLAAFDAQNAPCTYPSVVGGDSVDCADLQSMIGWWRDPVADHPPAEDLNGNGHIDVLELTAVLNCSGFCGNSHSRIDNF